MKTIEKIMPVQLNHHRRPVLSTSKLSMGLPSEEIIQSFTGTSGKLLFLYGDSNIFKLSFRIAAFSIIKGNIVTVVDGCNQFDVHAFSLFAHRLKIKPNFLLQRIFISRGFTCYQIEQTITHKLPNFLAKIHSRNVLILGLLDTFYDEQVPIQDAKRILGNVTFSLNKLKSDGISLLITCPERTVIPKQRNQLFTALKDSMDKVYRLSNNKEGKPEIFIEINKSRQVAGNSLLNY